MRRLGGEGREREGGQGGGGGHREEEGGEGGAAAVLRDCARHLDSDFSIHFH